MDATVRVERAMRSEEPAEVRVQLSAGGPEEFDRMAAGFNGLGRAMFFLTRYDGEPLTAYDTGLYRMAEEDS